MLQTLRAFSKKAILITTAFVLAVSSLFGAGSLFFSQVASAVSDASYTAISLNDWTKDRTYPTGGYSVESFAGRQSISLGVDRTQAAANSWYRYEGVKTDIGQRDSVKADLYIDSDWLSKEVSAGIWGVGRDSSDAISAYPIVTFTKNSTVDGWRIWDSADPGGWVNSNVAYNVNAWNTIELTLNKTDNTQVDVYINDTYAGKSTSDPTEYLSEIILNSYNYATYSYTSHWSNIQVGDYKPDAPTNLRISKNGTDVSSGTAVGPSFISGNVVLDFAAVAGSDKYVTQLTYPGGSVDLWNSYNNTWLVKNGLISQGQFSQHGDGVYTYKVKARDAVTGLWSDWSESVSLNYDSTAPEITSITANGCPVALDGSSKVSAKDGVTFQAEAADVSGFGYTYVEMNKNLNWQAANTGAASTTLSTAASKYIDGQQYGLKICPHDKLGNGACTQVYFTIDNTAPTMLLREGENGSIINSGSIIDTTGKNIRIEKENTATIHVTKPDGSTWTGGKKDTSYSGGKLSLDWLFTVDGLYTFYVEDEAGNISSDYTVTIDTAGPTIENVSVAKRYTNENTATVSGTISDTNLDYYRCSVYDSTNKNGLNASLGDSGYYTRYYTSVTGGELCNIPIANLSDGDYNVRVVAYDKAGHTNVNNYTGYPFTVDKTDPKVEINNVAPKATYKIGDTINVHVIDNNLDRVEIDRVDSAAPANDKHWVYTGAWFGLAWLKDGTYKLTAYDKAGNSITYTFSTDETRPIVTGSTESAINPNSLTITATDNVAVQRITGNIYKYDPANTGSDSEGYYLFKSNSSTTENPFTVDLSVLADGTYYVRYNASDTVGNISNTERFNFRVDNTAPVVVVNAIASGTNVTPTITGTTSEPGGDVNIMLNGTEVGIVTSDANGIWSWTPNTPMTVGPYTIVAVATDTAGNTSASDTSAEQPYWKQFSVLAANGGNQTNTGATPVTAPIVRTPLLLPAAAVVGATPAIQGQAVVASDDSTSQVAAAGTADNNGDTLGIQDEQQSWSLVNALLSIVAAVVAIVALARAGRIDDEKKKTSKTLALVAVLLAAVSIVLFFVVENLSLPIGLVNVWTLLFAPILVLQLIVAAKTK